MNDKILDFIASEDKNDVRVVVAKNNKTYILINQPSFNRNLDTRIKNIRMYDENLEEAGFVTYAINEKKKFLTLSFIGVKGEKNYGLGLGFYMLKMTEEIAYKNNCQNIYGNLAPSKGKRAQVEEFYERNFYNTTVINGVEYISKPITQGHYLNTRMNTRKNEFGYKQYRSIEYFNKSLKTRQQLNELSKNPA